MVGVLKQFGEVVGVGLAGSRALGVQDEHSDVDTQAFVDEIPSLERRKEVYGLSSDTETGPLDHPVSEEFQNPPCTVHFVVDWLRIGGVKCDVLWLTKHDVNALLSALPGQPEQRETIAVLAQTVCPLFDPHGYVGQLKRNCPEYPEDRARRKATGKLQYAHFFLCSWGVLQTCIRREDIVAYQQAESEMIGLFVDALFAVNRTWQHDRRRLRFHARGFRILPDACLDRLEAVVMRKDKHKNLGACHLELLSLFHDLAAAANEEHPGWQLRTDWRVKEK